MNLKEVLPAFIWAGVVIGATSLALAWFSSVDEGEFINDHSDEATLHVSPFDR
jgi:hypothetical protein